MSSDSLTTSADHQVSRVNDEIDVGSDMEFQKRWWRFERFVWIVFTAIIVLDALGAFGSGYLAKSHITAPDGSMKITYDRIMRYSTPSTLIVRFEPAAIHGGKVELWVSDAIVNRLGTRRIVPRPAAAVLERQGIRYTFSALSVPTLVEFSLEPRRPGLCHLALEFPGSPRLAVTILVMP